MLELMGWQAKEALVIGVATPELAPRYRGLRPEQTQESWSYYVEGRLAPPPTVEELAYGQILVRDPQYVKKQLNSLERAGTTLRRIVRWNREDGVEMEGIVACTLVYGRDGTANHYLFMLQRSTIRLLA